MTVFVTGAGTGLGKAIAAEFARLGAVDRDREPQARAPRRRPRRDRGDRRARCSPSRATSATPSRSRPRSTPRRPSSGCPGVLVNNAAANFPVPAEDMSPNAWRTVVDITLNGTFLCAREFGRRHIAAGTPGSIINIGASYAWTGGPGFVHSAAAKAGVKNLTESLAVEWGPYGIQVNGLVPGLFPHEDMTADIRGNLDRTDDKDACQPALRVGQRQELGWAATFLASPYARFISGHTLVVDGANWQRRSMTNPPVVTIRDQMGRGPFEADPRWLVLQQGFEVAVDVGDLREDRVLERRLVRECVSAAASRHTGASRYSKHSSATNAAISAPNPHVSVSSCSTSTRPVLRTDSATMLAVPRRDRAQVDDLDAGVGAELLRGELRAVHGRAPRDDRDAVAARHVRAACRTAASSPRGGIGSRL